MDPRILGSHYSPEPLVRQVVERVLAPLLSSGRFHRGALPEVLDPACGDGVFLRVAGDRLRSWLGSLASDATGPEPGDTIGAALHGVDRDSEAVGGARRALADSGYPAAHLVRGNSLVAPGAGVPAAWDPLDWREAFGPVRVAQGFDAVVGNPPYVDAETMARYAAGERRYLASRYETTRGAWDLFCPFVERCASLLAPGGRLGLILPNKVIGAGYAAGVRRVLAGLGMRVVQDYSGVRVFRAAVYPVVVVAERSGGAAACRFERAIGPLDALRLEPLGEVSAEGLLATAEAGWSAALTEGSPAAGSRGAAGRVGTGRLRPLGELCEVSGAATVSEAYRLQPLLQEASGAEVAGGAGEPGASARAMGETVPVVNTGTLDPHQLLWGRRAMRYLGRSYRRPTVSMQALERQMPRRAAQARARKIVVAGMTRRLECVYDPGTVLAAKSTSLLLLPPGRRGERMGWFLVGLLNSGAASERYALQFGGLALSSGYLRVGPPQLRALLVVDPDGVDGRSITRIVRGAKALARMAARGVADTDPRWRSATARLDAVCAALYAGASRGQNPAASAPPQSP